MAVVVPFESPEKPSIDPLVDLVSADMERVNGVILTRTGSEVTMIPEVANHLISSGGKRLRPMLTLALARLTGYGGDGHIKLAAAVEFMHTATLLHDDVVDESELRRGQLAARKVWGNQASVLVGDFLLGQAFKMMVEVGSLKALEILSSAAAVIAEGEVMQHPRSPRTRRPPRTNTSPSSAPRPPSYSRPPVKSGRFYPRGRRPSQAACRSFGMNLVTSPSNWSTTCSTMAARPPSSARMSATIFAKERSLCPSCSPSAAAATPSANSGGARRSSAAKRPTPILEHAIRLMIKHRALEDTIGRAHRPGAIARDALALFPD